MTFLRTLYADLRERQIFPAVVVLAVLAVAIPIVASKVLSSYTPPPVPTLPAPQVKLPKGVAAPAKELVVLDTPPPVTSITRKGSEPNPFREGAAAAVAGAPKAPSTAGSSSSTGAKPTTVPKTTTPAKSTSTGTPATGLSTPENVDAMKICEVAYLDAVIDQAVHPGTRVTRQLLQSNSPEIQLGPTTPGTPWLVSASGYGTVAPTSVTCASSTGYRFTAAGSGYQAGSPIGGTWTGPDATQGTWIDEKPGQDQPVMTLATATTPSTTKPNTSASGGSSPNSTPPAKATPAIGPASLKSNQAYTVNIDTKDATGTHALSNVVRLAPLPAAETPEVIFLGVVSGGKKAAFLFTNTVQVSADTGKDLTCLPDNNDCQIVELSPGQGMSLAPTSNAALISTFTFELMSIGSETFANSAAAMQAREAVSTAGQTLLPLSTSSALQTLRFDASTGALVEHAASHGGSTGSSGPTGATGSTGASGSNGPEGAGPQASASPSGQTFVASPLH
jgi:hypothetical protein